MTDKSIANFTKDSSVNQLDYFVVSFRIMSDKLKPQTITSLLRIEPDSAHEMGDCRSYTTKKGKTIAYAPFKSGLWSISSELEKTKQLEDHLLALFELLEPKKAILATLRKDGFEMDFHCGHFLCGGSQ